MADHQRAFFAVYDMETTEIVAFYQVSVLFPAFSILYQVITPSFLILTMLPLEFSRRPLPSIRAFL